MTRKFGLIKNDIPEIIENSRADRKRNQWIGGKKYFLVSVEDIMNKNSDKHIEVSRNCLHRSAL